MTESISLPNLEPSRESVLRAPRPGNDSATGLRQGVYGMWRARPGYHVVECTRDARVAQQRKPINPKVVGAQRPPQQTRVRWSSCEYRFRSASSRMRRIGGHNQGPPSSKVELSIPGPSIPYPMERTQNRERSPGNALSVLIARLLFGRETHGSTTQSDPLLLPTRNGPYREDGALRWEYLF
jgi:hypothetical protein